MGSLQGSVRRGAAIEKATAFRRVLCATDFSGSAALAARLARRASESHLAELHFLHVTKAPALVEPSLAELREWTNAFALGFGARTAVRVGPPAAEIVRYAAEHRMDLIVVGSHGCTGATALVLGSVAERVARTAPCPVLVVPAEGAAEEGGRTRCALCSSVSEDLFCEPCRARIRAIGGTAKHPIVEGTEFGALDDAEIDRLLHAEVVGRLACCANGRPYVVPMAYFYDGEAIYFRSNEGMKVRIMRASPEVCLQVDHIVDLAHWGSVIARGVFEELGGTEATRARRRLLEELARRAGVGDAARPIPAKGEGEDDFGHRAVSRERDAVLGRIRIVEKTGRFERR